LIIVTRSLQDGILNLLDLIILRPEGLEGFNGIKKKLNNAVRLQLTGSDDLRTQKESKKGKSFVGNFKTKKSKHLISGLDREKVYGLPWVGYVVLVLDGFSLVDRERAPPLLVI
jgi:hypothetical protein